MSKVDVILFTGEFQPQVGGIATLCRELAKALTEKGVGVLVFAPWADPAAADDRALPFALERSPLVGARGPVHVRALAYLRASLRLAHLARVHKPKAVLLANNIACRVASSCPLPIERLFPMVYGSDILSNYGEPNRIKRWWKTRAYGQGERILAVSGYTRQLLVDRGIPAEKVEVFYNGIDGPLWSAPPRTEAVDEFRRNVSPGGGPILLSLCRLDPRKGLDTAIRALPAVAREVPGMRYAIAGSGPDEERLRRVAAECGVADRVVFLGRVSEDLKISLYDACDVFVQPSRAEKHWVEGLGITFLEAAARGRPTIGGRHGGVPESILHGKTGLLVEPESPEALAGAIGTLLKDRALARQMGDAGRARMLTEFTWERRAEELMQIVEQGGSVRSSAPASSRGTPDGNIVAKPKVPTERRRRMSKVDVILFTGEFPPQVGGVGTLCRELAKALTENGVGVLVFAPEALAAIQDDKDLPYAVERSALVGARGPLHARVLAYMRVSLHLARVARAQRPVAILLANNVACRAAATCPVTMGRLFPIVHGSDILSNFGEPNRLKRWWKTRAYGLAERVLAVSAYTRQLLVDRGISGEEVKVFYNAIDDALWAAPPRASMVDEFRLSVSPDGGPILLSLCRLDPRKGLDAAIRAVPAVAREVPGMRYAIAGSGPDEQRLRQLAAECGVSDRVVFLGRVSEDRKISLYDACDVFVQPSRVDRNWVEGFGITFLEAAARGKPAIGSTHGGVPEAILDGKTGLLVEPESPEALAKAVITLLKDGSLARRMGDAGRARVLADFTWKKRAAELMQIVGRGRRS
jgi:phosphatidylinositol alpha-1,6-mannosyltransferase